MSLNIGEARESKNLRAPKPCLVVRRMMSGSVELNEFSLDVTIVVDRKTVWFIPQYCHYNNSLGDNAHRE
jgi:hypothetical protein